MSAPVSVSLRRLQHISLNSSYLFDLMTSASICFDASTANKVGLYLLSYANADMFAVFRLYIDVGCLTDIKSKHKSNRYDGQAQTILKAHIEDDDH